MKDEDNYVYRIWDVDNNQYWHSPSGKRQFTSPEMAKNAWNSARCWQRNEQGHRVGWNDFEETSRGFVLHKFRLQRVTS